MAWRRRLHQYVNSINTTKEVDGVSTSLNNTLRKKDRKSKRKKRHERLKRQNFDIENQENVSRETSIEESLSLDEFEAVETSPFDADYNDKVLQEQQERFNKTQEEREDISDQKRRATFEEKHGIFGQQYNVLTSVLGSNLYRMLKESMHLDSNQIMDLTYDYNGIANEKDIEHALLTLISKINDEYKSNVNMLLDAMALGFSLEDSEYLLENDLKYEYAPVKGTADLRDILIDELGIDDRTQLKQELWEEWEK